MHHFKNPRWRLWFSEGANASTHTNTPYTPMRIPPHIHMLELTERNTRMLSPFLYPCWPNFRVMLCVTVRRYRELRLESPFMSPLFLRYAVTANMKSGLFCQKCVNKHGNTSSEGHNSILHDKCCESAVAFRFSPKITEQTKSWLSQIVIT